MFPSVESVRRSSWNITARPQVSVDDGLYSSNAAHVSRASREMKETRYPRQGSGCDGGGGNRASTGGGGGGYAGRGLGIGLSENIGGMALCATSPKQKVAPINQGSRTHTE